jgi:cell division protein FtsB
MKWMLGILIILLAALQYRLWISEGSLADVNRLEREIKIQQADNSRLRERNRILAVEVEDLKTGLDSVEERARNDQKRRDIFYDSRTPALIRSVLISLAP